MREREVRKMGLSELLGGLAIYIAILVPALKFGPRIDAGIWRTLALTSPMIGFCLALWAVVRQLRRSDEYMRLHALENIAISAALTAGWTFTYGFLENAGYPRLSMFIVWPVMGATMALLACLRALLKR